MRNIMLLGLISFFTDVSTEMVYPLIPLYLTATFGATPALIGLIEGVAESLASLLKVFSGYVSDRFQHKRRLAFTGYALGLAYKLALLVAGSWGGVLAARVVDRLGKGIRTAPRDVLVSESADRDRMGRAFGIHKSLDMAGSSLGILLAWLLVTANAGADGDFDYKRLFLLAVIPAVLGLALFAFVREKKVHMPVATREPFWRNMGKLDGQLRLYLAVVFLFTLGNSSNAFLLLRARNVGYGGSEVILVYLVYNVVASLLAIPMGHRSDRIGRKRLLVAGYLAFSLVYFGFAVATSRWTILLCFALYGIHTAMVAGVERAYIAQIAPPALKGTMLGLHATLAGIALLPASVIAGLLWNGFGASAPFCFGAGMSLLAALILQFRMKEPHTPAMQA